MKVIINIENNFVRIALQEKEAILDEISFPLDHNLSAMLLPTIDKILKKNGFEPNSIEKIEYSGDVGESYTTYRIAKAVENAFNWAKSHNA
jgi:tRNA A37 threonylcarbamoyladenosine modification protein TsaB